MSLVGSCYICSGPAMYSCSVCGRVACSEHYIKQRRICTSCQGRLGESDEDEEYNPHEILF